MNQTLEKNLLGGFFILTMGAMYISLDKASKMTQVNPDNKTILYFKTTTNETYSATNTNFKN